jgi:hypothetical protein
MRDHYSGDLSDLIKFSFLRSLAGCDRSLGVGWYYVSTIDNEKDGKHLDWKHEERWSLLDTTVHSQLSQLSERKVSALQACLFWPKNTSFHLTPIPSGDQRPSWVSEKRKSIGDSEIIFLDPDNGLSEFPTIKHVTYDEVRFFLDSGKCVVFITFPKRVKHYIQVQQLHADIVERTGAKCVWTMRVSVSIRNRHNTGYVPTFRWLTVINPDSEIAGRAKNFGELLSRVSKIKVRNDRYPST